MNGGDVGEELNERQQEAVTATEGPVLVIAGAGTGKTRVIEYRVRHLVETGVEASSILLLAFTRRSAREMVSRAARLDPRCSGVEGGTFHSFANKMLRRYSHFFDLPVNFTVYDEADAEEAIERCAVRLGFFSREKRRPRKDMLRKIVSMAVNKGMPLGEVLERYYPPFVEHLPEIGKLREEYAAYKLSTACLDYDDLLLYLKILLEDEDVQRAASESYRYVMVDEFQDTNAMQADIAYRLARRHRNILVVGDDAQSIYGFRGATHENIMRFPERFPGCRVITLEENYRSTQAILDLGNAVLRNMAHRYDKSLRAAKKEHGQKPRLIYFKDGHEEAAWVAGKIKELYEEGMELSHQCILFRSAYVTIPLQTELARRNIPFSVYGGLRFYETAHVKDVVAHLRLFLNPKDELAWSRVLLLVDGIGPRTAEKLIQAISVAEEVESMLEKAFAAAGPRAAYREGLARLATLFRVASRMAHAGGQCEAVIDYYGPIMREKFDLDWHLRKNDLEALAQVAGRYDALRDLLLDLAIEPPERGVADFHDDVWERPLILSTIHSAKGLEWRNVFLVGAEEGVLPSSYATHDEEELEEEHRLLYVAVTRARERLWICIHHEGRNNGIRTFNRLSRFIDQANVRACLNEQHGVASDGQGVGQAPAAGPPGFRRAELLAKLLDSMK